MIPIPRHDEVLVGSEPMQRRWWEYLFRINTALNGPLPLRSFTVAALPADPNDGLLAFVSDAGGGAVPVYSRGGLWRRFDNNAEVS